MNVLYFFESIRCPFLDTFMSIITRLGEETIFLVLALFVFWCINKYEGYYLLSVGLFGTVLNQILKIIFRIPRPWVLDEGFTIVESAREAATGYSFPSGHTQNSVGIFGSIVRWNRQKAVRIICVLLCVLVPVSRMYLGVHTPLDVFVSVAIALLLVFGAYPLVRAAEKKPSVMLVLLLIMSAVALGGVLFVNLYSFPADVDAANLLSAQGNLSKLFGALVGATVVFIIDNKYTRFKCEAGVLGQICKLVLGLLLVLALKSGLKPVTELIFGDLPIRHSLRYFLMVVFAGAVWPLTFPFFSRLGGKKK